MTILQSLNWKAILIAVAATLVAAVIVTLIVAVETLRLKGGLP